MRQRRSTLDQHKRTTRPRHTAGAATRLLFWSWQEPGACVDEGKDVRRPPACDAPPPESAVPITTPPRARRGEPSPYALDGFCSVTPEDPLENQLADAMGGLRCSRATRASESTPAPPPVPQQQKAVEELASSMVSPTPLPKCERLRSCAIRPPCFTAHSGRASGRLRRRWAVTQAVGRLEITGHRARTSDGAVGSTKHSGAASQSHASVTAACRPIPTYVALSLPPPQLTVDPQLTTGAQVTTLGEGCDAEQGRLPSAKV